MYNIKEFNSANTGGKGYKIIIGILVVILIALGYLFINQQQKTKKIITELNDTTKEKVELTKEYESLLQSYDEIETTNDSISSQLNHEKERINELIAELKTNKAQNRSELKKYKSELKTLRNIMKGFVRQIDSLNIKNIELTAENTQIKSQFKTAKIENKQLADKYDEANDMIKIASVIKAVNVSLTSFNHKGKPTNRAKKTKRFAVNFALGENTIAPTGIKNVYLRITDPVQHILIENNQPVFSYEGEEIAYSSVREVEYDGTLTNAVVFFRYNSNEVLSKGIYSVDIFCDGSMIGSATVELK